MFFRFTFGKGKYEEGADGTKTAICRALRPGYRSQYGRGNLNHGDVGITSISKYHFTVPYIIVFCKVHCDGDELTPDKWSQIQKILYSCNL